MSPPEIKEDNAVEIESDLVEDNTKTPPRSQILEKTPTDQTVAAETGQMKGEINIEISDDADGNTRTRHLELYRAALSGDWNTAASIFDKHPSDISAPITKHGDTVLHVAAAANSTSFARKLVIKMKEEDLTKLNAAGNTACHYAASSGNWEIARVMIDKNSRVAMIRRSADDLLPFDIAALSGHSILARRLYGKTNLDKLNDKDRFELLVALINSDLYDLALLLVKENPILARYRDRKGETALHAFARKSKTFSKLTDLSQRRMVKGLFKLYTKFDDSIWQSFEALQLVEKIWKEVILLDDQRISELIGRPWGLIFVAAEKGNFMFLRVLIGEYPDIIWTVDDNGYTIFHIAVLNRQEKIFELIHDIGPIKDSVVSSRDKDGNSILHLAGMLPSTNRLNVVTGAALQMRRELIWFKEVSKIVRPSDAEAENKMKKTPLELFVESHSQLKKEGETWMKDTADSCMVVATLVTTVVFAAAFTIPGGSKGDTGAPNFLREVSFKIFVLSDALSLIFSSVSILCFLSILTSICSEEDFLFRLHKNLLGGFASLFASIAAMMVVFCTTCFVIFNGETLWIPILATVLASIPLLLFLRQHYGVFVTLLRSATLQSLS